MWAVFSGIVGTIPGATSGERRETTAVSLFALDSGVVRKRPAARTQHARCSLQNSSAMVAVIGSLAGGVSVPPPAGVIW
jgi:hypothetical protein